MTSAPGRCALDLYAGPKLRWPPRTETHSSETPAESVQVSALERTTWTS
jgi:hypothetical protein